MTRSNKDNIKIIAFDLDGTLTTEFSWNLFHEVGGVTSEEQYQWRNQYFKHEISYREWIRLIENKYRQSGKTNSDFLKTTRAVPFRKDTRKVIQALLPRYEVHLVSSSIDIYVKYAARALGITKFHANHSLVFDSRQKFISIKYQASEQEAKVQYLIKLCNQFKLIPQEICFVGDSDGDIDAFKFTGRGILVGEGNQKLQQTAWKKVKNLTEILELLLP